MAKIQIYITDDDEDDRMFIRRAINNVIPTANIVEAKDGVDLLEKLQDSDLEKQFTIILIDMNMPRLNGLETITQLKSDEKLQKISTIMISTSENVELKQQAYNLGVDSFITKPFTFDEYEAIATGLKSIYFNEFVDFVKKDQAASPAK